MHILILALLNANDKILKRDDYLILIIHFILCILLIFLLLAFPGLAHEGVDRGMVLFLEALFPYLLPYLILTQWLLRLTASLNRPLSQAKLYIQTYLISALGGFPTGASTIAFLKNNGQINAREASILLAICHAPSPLFVIGFVGTELLGNYAFGWKFLSIIHGLNIFALILYARKRAKLPYNMSIATQQRSSSPFSDSLKDSAPILLLVGITIIFFTTIQNILLTVLSTFLPNFSKTGHLLFTSLLEMTNGLVMAESLYQGSAMLPVIIASILAFQGLSIHLQVIVIARTAQLSIRPYLVFRLLSLILVPILYFAIFIYGKM